MRSARASASGYPVLVALVLLIAPSADASSPHLLISEVFPGSTEAGAGAEFVELQMIAPNQNDIDGQELHFYGTSGSLTDTFTVPSDVPKAESQRTVLFATAEADSVGAGSPDFSLLAGDRLDSATGAVCLTGDGASDDCVSWGSLPLLSAALPDPQVQNLSPVWDGNTLGRAIEAGCPTFLDPADDTDNSYSDFNTARFTFPPDGPVPPLPPTPRRNSAVPPEAPCEPNTFLMLFPRNPTNETSASFSYQEYPPDPVIAFSCALDWQGGLGDEDFSFCPPDRASFAGLADGQHRFAVRASGQGGTDPSPDIFTWTVDTTPPETTIASTPPDPSWGFRLNYTFSSSESESAFRCQLDEGPIEVCVSEGIDYFDQKDGPHTFRVWAIDNAGNKDPTPDVHRHTVDTRIGDRTPPKTRIVSTPRDPTPHSSASFTYTSNEPESSFECRIAPKPFVACPAQGIAYRDLPNSPYAFDVRAIDRAGNVDAVPARHSWRVAKPAPRARFIRTPGGALRRGKPALFAFRASEPGAGFRCRLDLAGSYRRCSSPHRITAKPGRHVFEVIAFDRLGNTGDAPALRIFRVRSKDNHSWFAQNDKLLSSFEAEMRPTALPRERFAPVSLRFASNFENLDGTDTPDLRAMKIRLARGGIVESKGLARCREPQLRFRTSDEALALCRPALVGEGWVSTALRFPEGSRIPAKARALLFNAPGARLLLHIYADRPVEGTVVAPISVRKAPAGTVLRARFPRIAGGNGFLTGFEITLRRQFHYRGKQQSYLGASCPIPRDAGLRRIAFELAHISYYFEGGRELKNSSLNTCTVTQ